MSHSIDQFTTTDALLAHSAELRARLAALTAEIASTAMTMQESIDALEAAIGKSRQARRNRK